MFMSRKKDETNSVHEESGFGGFVSKGEVSSRSCSFFFEYFK